MDTYEKTNAVTRRPLLNNLDPACLCKLITAPGRGCPTEANKKQPERRVSTFHQQQPLSSSPAIAPEAGGLKMFFQHHWDEPVLLEALCDCLRTRRRLPLTEHFGGESKLRLIIPIFMVHRGPGKGALGHSPYSSGGFLESERCCCL